jgi:hypothetical protein
MFADDVVIWTKTKNKKTQQLILEKTMKPLDNYENGQKKTICKLILIKQTTSFSMKHNNYDFNLSIANKLLTKSENTKYLGVQLDNKLNWTYQIESTGKRLNQRSALIKCLSSVIWGSSQETLNMTYRTYIKPIVKYGSEVIITTNDTRLNKLKCLQNNILRLITGAVKTTPVASLQLYTHNKPIVEEIKQQSALTYIKMKSLQDMNWINGTLVEEKLKTQKNQ